MHSQVTLGPISNNLSTYILYYFTSSTDSYVKILTRPHIFSAPHLERGNTTILIKIKGNKRVEPEIIEAGASRGQEEATRGKKKGSTTKMASDASKLPRRIVKETQRLIAEPVAGISATPYADNLRYFAVSVEGPSDSPYERGVFQLELFLPSDYPMAPPKVRFLTKIYHPNVDKLGRICLDILKDKWSPALQIRTVLLSIQALLSAPNPDDPLDNTVAELWKSDEKEAMRRAREYTASFASPVSK